MIAHVLLKEQGFPQGSKMPGAFKTVEDMLTAFVRDYKPRSSKPEQGKVQELEYNLITFTLTEILLIGIETDHRDHPSAAMIHFASKLNKKLGLAIGFQAVLYDTVPQTSSIDYGLLYTPQGLSFVSDDSELKTGPTKNTLLELVEHSVIIIL